MANVLSISEEDSQGKSESEESNQLKSERAPKIGKLFLEGKLEDDEEVKVEHTQISGLIDTQGMLISQADEECSPNFNGEFRPTAFTALFNGKKI